MSTRGIGARRRPRLGAALVALALIVAAFALTTQATSIWSTRSGSQIRPIPAHTALSVNPDLRTGSHISTGCWRRKYGCPEGETTTVKRP